MIRSVFCLLVLFAIVSCAKQGIPTGGDKDIYPPKFLKSFPDTLSRNVPINIKEIRIDFDEYIVLKDVQKQITISPPFKNSPIILPTQNSPKKYISIAIKDSLQPNTTYNINFGESIQDNTESNKLDNFSYIFSTGKTIDSLTVSGKISRSFSDDVNLKTIIALYKKDTAEIDLNKKPFYITKIDSAGNYKLKYLSAGKYQLIAFTDEDFNSRYESNKEEFGFSSDIIDLDSNSTKNVVLFKASEPYKVVSIKQDGQGKFIITTNGKPKNIKAKPLYDGFPEKYYQTHKARTDSTFIWFNPKNAKFEQTNQRVKFVVEFENKKDTISTLYDSKKVTKLIVSNDPKEMTPGEVVVFKFNNYIESVDESKITIKKTKALRSDEEMVKKGENPVTEDVKFSVELNKENNTELQLKFPIEFERKYSIDIQPNAFIDILGNLNDSLVHSFTTKAKNEYGNLKLLLQNEPKKPFFLQLLQQNSVVKEVYGNKNEIEFTNLLPGEYSFRILVDENENAVWDTGDFKTKKQAEKTYSSPNIVTIRAFWDVNESWILTD